ncbi:hypothetical protein H6P81_019587 [Aristolochia fimbriata]|uniref:DUF7653 domain-containing protein n=1 Tax=Aristolochia fimbriata TaxID=158543 RepID=A0AAV7DVZ1_ARIFI|nr:hypothetical protein H6P81_019587 [Aristolochia fimbriata]
MRKIFSFRSSGSSNGSSNPAPPANKVNWEKPSPNKLKSDAGNRSQHNSHSLQDFSTRPRKHEESCESNLKRSLSFSSPITYSGPEWHLDSRDASISPTTSNYPHQDYDYAIWRRSLTPERISKSKKVDQVLALERVEKLESSGASTGYADLSWHSTYSSPVPLKCRAPHITQVPNKVLDRYIDGEQPDRITRPITEPCQMNSLLPGRDDFPVESRLLPSSRYQPQGRRPTFQKDCHEHLNSHKFVGDPYPQNSGDWARDEVQPSSSQRLARSVIERLTESFPEKCAFESQDFNTETSTIVEDIYEEYSDIHPVTYPNEFPHQSSRSSDAHYGATDRYPINVSSTLKEDTMFTEDDPECLHFEISHLQEQVEVEVELQRKGQEVQQRVLRLLKLLEEGKVPKVNIAYEMRNLVFEFLSQIQGRITERASAGKAFKRAKTEFDSRIKGSEKEKNEIQATLEKELDRRSREWSFKLEKFQLDEQRLRQRIRELAEQNVSLQREVSTNSKDMESITKISDLGTQLNNATLRIEEMGSDNCKLQAVVSELQDRFRHAQSDRDSIVRSYKEKEKEIKDLHKAVARLQRIYYEQEKTISGLQQGLCEEINTQSFENCDKLVKLQLEQVRLTSVEQNHRKEIEHYKVEIYSLRQENIALLDRLNGGRSSSFRLEEELKARVNYFESRCLSLLEDSSQISEKLLTLVKMSHIDEGMRQKEVKSGLDEFVVLECDMKFQSFGREIENFRSGLLTLTSILQEKTEVDASEFHSERSHCPVLKEEQVERELKAEILLTKALREKLHSQQLELEKLQADLATSTRCNDILRCEIQRAQDAFSSLTHRMKDLELQMMRKNENINQLQMDLKENMKELTASQGTLTKVSGERDMMWEEVKECSEKNMLLNCEMASLRKKIEALDEDILLKEGQITILKDTLKEKPFGFIYDPNSLKGSLFNEPF